MNLKLIKENKRLQSFDFKAYWDSIKFAFYTMTHPLDGFWDLTREKRGTMAAAHTFVFVMVAVEIMRRTLSSFQFVLTQMEYFNVIMVISQILVPIGLWTVANWCLTTLMDGKGHLSHIYMAVAYATVPFTIIHAILIPISHIITFDEGAIYYGLATVAVIWMAFLIVCGMMQIHEYTMSKTLLSSLFTFAGIAIMIFIFIVFFAVVSDGVNYFIALFREMWFRIT